MLGVGAIVLFLGEMVRYEKPGGTLANVAVAVFVWVYVGLMVDFAVADPFLLWRGRVGGLDHPRENGGHWRLYGRPAHRPPQAGPDAEPGKTIEGAFGALALACVGSWACFAWLMPLIRQPSVHGLSWGWLPFGLLMGIAGMVGNLAESLLKRDAGL